MAQTTTTTSQHWLLLKYSRSRSLIDHSGSPPAKRRKQGRVAGQASDEHIDWDHYSQPQLALRLETTFASAASSSSGSLLPLRMVLSVTFDPLFRDAVRDGNQQPLLLDRLDLTSFSSPAVRAATPPDQLPLKAVYRDAVLGLRYLSLSPSSRGGPNQPEVEFRRMQAKFTSNAERERFVEATKALVPAKPAIEAALPATAALTASPAPKKVSSPAKKAATLRRKKPVTSTRDLAGSSAAGANALAPSSAHFPPPAPDHARASTSTAQHLPYSSGPTAFAGPSISQHATTPPPFRSNAAQLSSSRLPETLSTLLPNLASTSGPSSSASRMLAALPPKQFEQLLQEALLEEGFEELVKRVQEVLTGQNAPGTA